MELGRLSGELPQGTIGDIKTQLNALRASVAAENISGLRKELNSIHDDIEFLDKTFISKSELAQLRAEIAEIRQQPKPAPAAPIMLPARQARAVIEIDAAPHELEPKIDINDGRSLNEHLSDVFTYYDSDFSRNRAAPNKKINNFLDKIGYVLEYHSGPYVSEFKTFLTDIKVKLLSSKKIRIAYLDSLYATFQGQIKNFGRYGPLPAHFEEIYNFIKQEIFEKYETTQGGGSNENIKQLLYDTAAAYLVKYESNTFTLKNLISTLISKNTKIVNNKIKINIPSSQEVLKIICLPLYCCDKGINVTFNNMHKCIKKDIYKLISSNVLNQYIKELNLNDNDKLIIKEYDKRVKQIKQIINNK